MEQGLFIPVTCLVSYAEAYGEAVDGAYLLMSYYNAGSLVGRVVPGLVADGCGRLNAIVVTIGLCVATTLGLWLTAGGSEGAAVTFAVLFGVASDSNLTLAPMCLGQLCDSREYGRLLSTAIMVASFDTLTGPLLGDALLLTGGGYKGWQALVLFCGLSYAAALGCFASANILAVGWNPRARF